MAFSDQFGLCGTVRSYYAGMLTWASPQKKKRKCRSCKHFHKGIKVDHSHCDNSRMSKILGHEKACDFWEKK